MAGPEFWNKNKKSKAKLTNQNTQKWTNAANKNCGFIKQI